MKIRYMSDLHLEFERYKQGVIVNQYEYFTVPEHADDSDTILVLAGDIGLIEKPYTYLTFMEKVGKQFKEVLYVPGNHEYYRGTLVKSVSRLKHNLSDINIRVLDDSSVKVGNVKFYGTTLWTDFNKGEPLALYQASQVISDYKVITEEYNGNYSRLRTKTILKTHKDSVDKLKIFLANNTDYVVVISHHLPSYNSVHPMYHGDPSTPCYYSDLDYIMEEYKPKIWIHGHTHESCDYINHGGTRVLCNPRGYVGDQLNDDFDVNKFVEI